MDSLLIDLLGANLLGIAAEWVTLQVHRKKGEETETGVVSYMRSDVLALCVCLECRDLKFSSIYMFIISQSSSRVGV